jgi:putative ABC transport system permease protein
MTNLWRDTLFGLRMLTKNPGFSAVALLALALGIGANTAIFSVIYATLMAPLPYPNPDQLVVVWTKVQGYRNVVSAGDFLDWQRENTVFQGMGTGNEADLNLSVSGKPEVVHGGYMTVGYLDKMIQEKPFMGRYFLPEEGQPGKDHVLIMTHRLWKERFGSDPNIIGKEIRVNGETYAVVGVRPAGQPDRMAAQLEAPLVFKPEQINHDAHYLVVLARMKPGVTLAQANADMESVAKHIAEVYPVSNKGWGVSVEPLKNDFLPPDVRKGLWLLMGSVGFVLLIACVNVANLLLARGAARQREVAVRASLGATRGRIFGQFLAESLVLATLGGILGVFLANVILDATMALLPPFTLPSEADVRLNVPVLLFTVAATMLSGVLFGCVPAWQAARQDLNEMLKEGGRTSASAGRNRLRRTLVAAEFALALTLLAGAGLAIHSLWKLTNVDLGFRTDHLLTFSLPVPQGRLTQAEQMITFYHQLLERVKAVPGVSSASASTGMPVRGTGFGMAFQLAGKPTVEVSARQGAGFNMVTPEYFQTFGMRIDKGRAFDDRDVAGGVPVAIVNETFVKQYLAGVDPLTQRLVIEQLIAGLPKLGPPIEWQIVGVYHNVKNGGPRGDGFPEIDVPFAQSAWPQASIAVRTAADPAAVTSGIAEAILSMDRDLPMADVKTMDRIVDESMAGDRFIAAFFGGYAATALILAAVGIYGVMSFAVAQRTHEIGLRMALGAGQAQVLRLVLTEGMISAGAGLVVGLAGAFFVGRLMKSMLYNVGGMDYGAFGAVAAMLLASALLACYLPARRAAAVDPIIALREE